MCRYVSDYNMYSLRIFVRFSRISLKLVLQGTHRSIPGVVTLCFYPTEDFCEFCDPQFHNTLYFCEFCDSCTTIPYTSVSSVTDQVPHRDYPDSSVYNTLNFCEFCDSCTTIPYTCVSSVAHPVPYRDYPPVLCTGGNNTRGTGKHSRNYPPQL